MNWDRGDSGGAGRYGSSGGGSSSEEKCSCCGAWVIVDRYGETEGLHGKGMTWEGKCAVCCEPGHNGCGE